MSQRALRTAVCAIALVPPLAYALAALSPGTPSFPGDRGECAGVAPGDAPSALGGASGRYSTVPEAEAALRRLARGGVTSLHVVQDGCGRFKVTADPGT
jgi:hypothetical protein